jgi:uncharacterized protein YbjT (DUF2867 family)
MRVFLTGASGYIGGAGAVKLVNAGAVVRGLVRDPQFRHDRRMTDHASNISQMVVAIIVLSNNGCRDPPAKRRTEKRRITNCPSGW